MQIGSFCYFVWVICGLLPVSLGHSPTNTIIVWVVMIISAVIIGFGASLLWVGQGIYVTDCSTDENNGFHFGLFWCILMFSQILGSVIAAFILGIFSQKVFFIIMGCFAFLGFTLFLFLAEPVKEDATSSIHSQTQSRSSGQSDSQDRTGGSESEPLLDSLEHDINTSAPNSSLPQVNLRSTVRMLFTVKMLKVLMLMIASGLVLAVYSGLLVKMISNTIEDKDSKLTKSLYCMIVFGVGEVLGAIVIGKIIDFASNKAGVFCVMIIFAVTTAVSVYTHSRNHYDVFWFFTAFAWGFTDSTSYT